MFILEDDSLRIEKFKQATSSHEVTIATSVEEGKALWSPPYDVVLLDHDLGSETFVPSEDPNTGFIFAKFIKDSLTNEEIVIHSFNPDGARNIFAMLVGTGKSIELFPFGDWLLSSLKNMASSS